MKKELERDLLARRSDAGDLSARAQRVRVHDAPQGPWRRRGRPRQDAFATGAQVAHRRHSRRPGGRRGGGEGDSTRQPGHRPSARRDVRARVGRRELHQREIRLLRDRGGSLATVPNDRPRTTSRVSEWAENQSLPVQATVTVSSWVWTGLFGAGLVLLLGRAPHVRDFFGLQTWRALSVLGIL